jgi:hypothetical protein
MIVSVLEEYKLVRHFEEEYKYQFDYKKRYR